MKQKIDLRGKTLTLPEKAQIKFTGGGQFYNGKIVGDSIMVSCKTKRVLFNHVLLSGKGWESKTAFSEWFGIIPDCTLDKDLAYVSGTDNFHAFQNLLLFNNIVIKKGVYYVKGNLQTTRSDQMIEGNCAIIKGQFFNKFLGIISIGSLSPSDGITRNVCVSNLTLIGVKGETSEKTEWGHGMAVRNSIHVLLNNVRCKKCKGDGFNITETRIGGDVIVPEDIEISNCSAIDNYRCGLSITGGKNVRIINSSFNETAGTSPQAGIDIEPNHYMINGNTYLSPCQTITIDGCKFENNSKYGIKIDGYDDKYPVYSIGDVTIKNSHFYQNRVSIWRIKDFTIVDCSLVFNRVDYGIVFQNEQQENVTIRRVNIRNSEIDESMVHAIYFSPSKKRMNFTLSDICINGAYQYGIYLPNVLPGQSFENMTCENIEFVDCKNGIKKGAGIKHLVIK
jgi:hypothetical protein